MSRPERQTRPRRYLPAVRLHPAHGLSPHEARPKAYCLSSPGDSPDSFYGRHDSSAGKGRQSGVYRYAWPRSGVHVLLVSRRQTVSAPPAQGSKEEQGERLTRHLRPYGQGMELEQHHRSQRRHQPSPEHAQRIAATRSVAQLRTCLESCRIEPWCRCCASKLTPRESIWPTLWVTGILRPMIDCNSCGLSPLVGHACTGGACKSIVIITAPADSARRARQRVEGHTT